MSSLIPIGCARLKVRKCFPFCSLYGEGRPVQTVTFFLVFSVLVLRTINVYGHGERFHKHDSDYEKNMGPHHGLVSAFYNPEGKISGYLELKLHHDRGDLELWLAKDRNIKHPFDLPLESTVTVTFLDHSGKSATLRIRNTNKNEDEDGNKNIRDNHTNYFIFPGKTGAESKWLMGKDLKASVVLSFSYKNTTYGSDIFTLVPH